MIETEKRSLNGDSETLHETEPRSTGLISRWTLIRKLKRSREARARFVESHLDKSLAFQIRSLRDGGPWTQAEFAEKLGIKHQNNVSARLENPNYGKHTLTTLKKIAATCDVALVVWFIPFSRFVDWATATPYEDKGLSPSFYDVPSFDNDQGLKADEAILRALGRAPVHPFPSGPAQKEVQKVAAKQDAPAREDQKKGVTTGAAEQAEEVAV